MDYATVTLLALIFLTVATDAILKRLSNPAKSRKRRFPICPYCSGHCIKMPTIGNDLPDRITFTLQKYRLPELVVTCFMCAKKGCCYIWWIPQIGDMPKGVFEPRRIN